MKYNEFKKKVQNWPVIFSKDVVSNGKSCQIVRNQLERWRKAGRIIRLKKGLFILSADDRKIEPSRAYIANQLYGPSYVSIEYALNYYGLIPETVIDVTSVTSRKTKRLNNEMGAFIYQHIKPEAYRGFEMVRGEGGLDFFIAEPEKSVIDFFYFNLEKFSVDDPDIFEESYRFQNTEKLNRNKILYYAKLFKSKKLINVARLFLRVI